MSASKTLHTGKTWLDLLLMANISINRFISPLLDEYDVVPGFSDLDDVEVPDYDFVSLYVRFIPYCTCILVLTHDFSLLRFCPLW